MDSTNTWLIRSALLLMAILFLWAGIFEKLLGWNETVGFLNSQGLPVPGLLALGSLLVELLAPIALLSRRWRGPAAMVLALYTIATALMFHTFWKYDDATHSQLQNFLKNVALTGAFLYVFTIERAQRSEKTLRRGDLFAGTLSVRM